MTSSEIIQSSNSQSIVESSNNYTDLQQKLGWISDTSIVKRILEDVVNDSTLEIKAYEIFLSADKNVNTEILSLFLNDENYNIQILSLQLLLKINEKRLNEIKSEIVNVLQAFNLEFREEAIEFLSQYIDDKLLTILAQELEEGNIKTKTGALDILSKASFRSKTELIAHSRLALADKIEDAIIDMIRSTDRDLQIAAAQAIGHLRLDKAENELIKNLNTRSVLVRVAFIDALGQILPAVPPRILRDILDKKNRYDETKIAILRVIATLNDTKAHDFVIGIKYDKNPLVRKEVAWTLGVLLLKKSIDHLLILLGDPNENVIEVAKQSLINYGEMAVEAVFNGMTDKSLLKNNPAKTKLAALEVIDNIDIGKYIDELLHFMNDDSPEIRAFIVSRLVRTKNRDKNAVINKMQKLVTGERHPLVTREIPYVLNVLDHTKSQSILEKMLRSGTKDYITSRNIVMNLDAMQWKPETAQEKILYHLAKEDYLGLSQISGKREDRYLIKLLQSKDETIITGILRSLKLRAEIPSQNLKKFQSTVRKLKFLEQESSKIELILVAGVLQINSLLDYTAKMWNEGSEKIRIAVIQSYAIRNTDTSVNNLLSMVLDANETERPLIIQTLANLHYTKPMRKLLVKGLDNKNRIVRSTIGSVLPKLEDKEFISDLVPYLSSSEFIVRNNAGIALDKLYWTPISPKEQILMSIALQKYETILESLEDKERYKTTEKYIQLIVQELFIQENQELSFAFQILTNYDSSLQYLRKSLQSSNTNEQLNAIICLGAHQSPKSVNLLNVLFKSNDEKILIQILETYLSTPHELDKRSLRFIEQSLVSPIESVKLAAIHCSVRLESIRPLLDILKVSEDQRISMEVIQGVTSVLLSLTKNIYETLIEYIDDDRYIVLEQVVVDVLTKKQPKDVLGLLLRKLSHGTDSAKIIAIQSIIAIDPLTHKARILTLLENGSNEVKVIILKEYIKHFTDEDQSIVLSLLQNTNLGVQHFAASVLQYHKWFDIIPEHFHLSYYKALGNWDKVFSVITEEEKTIVLKQDIEQAIDTQIPDLVRSSIITKVSQTGKGLEDIIQYWLHSNDEELINTSIDLMLSYPSETANTILTVFDSLDIESQAKLIPFLRSLATSNNEIEHKFIEIIKQKPTDDNLELRKTAMIEITFIDSEHAIPPLLDILLAKEEFGEIVQLARDEVIELKEFSLPIILERIAKSTSSSNLNTLIELVSDIGVEDSLNQLSILLKDPNQDVRYNTASALRRAKWQYEEDSEDQVNYYIALRNWQQVSRSSEVGLQRIIQIFRQQEYSDNIRKHLFDCMKIIWDSVDYIVKERLIDDFKRYLRTSNDPVWKYFIEAGVTKPKVSIFRSIGIGLYNFTRTNLYYLIGALSAIFIIGGLQTSQGNNLTDALPLWLQYSAVLIIFALQFSQGALITVYTERIIARLESVGGIFRRGSDFAIWSFRHFTMLVGGIFTITLYQFLTSEREGIIRESEGPIGILLRSVSAGRLVIGDIVIDVSLPNIQFDFPYLADIPLPDIAQFFSDNNLDTVLRGLVFLIMAFQVYDLSLQALYKSKPYKNNPRKAYQYFALPLGYLIFWTLAFVEDGVFQGERGLFAAIPTEAFRLGLLLGSLIYLVYFSKDKALGYMTVFSAFGLYGILKLLDVVTNQQGTLFGNISANLALFVVIGISSGILALHIVLSRQLRKDAGFKHSKSTANVLIRSHKYIWMTFSLSYLVYYLVLLFSAEINNARIDLLNVLRNVPATLIILLMWFLLFRMFINRTLRLGAISGIIPVAGITTVLGSSILGLEELFGVLSSLDPIVSIGIIFLTMLIPLRVSRRITYLAEKEAAWEDIGGRIRWFRRFWIILWLVYLLIYLSQFLPPALSEIINFINTLNFL